MPSRVTERARVRKSPLKVLIPVGVQWRLARGVPLGSFNPDPSNMRHLFIHVPGSFRFPNIMG